MKKKRKIRIASSDTVHAAARGGGAFHFYSRWLVASCWRTAWNKASTDPLPDLRQFPDVLGRRRRKSSRDRRTPSRDSTQL